jgi:primosomal protein N' (replication factor Y)
MHSVIKAEEIIKRRITCSVGVLYRKQTRDLEEWIRIKKGEVDIVIGARAGIFAPLYNLGLVIIDEEQDHVYKQEQVPHYNAREVAFMRIAIEKAKLILGSTSPSLESFYLAKKSKIQYLSIPRTRAFPEIKIVDMRNLTPILRRKNIILSKYLEDTVFHTLGSKGKILLFLNRKGFATFASCQACGMVLKCPRCNINLVYHFKNNVLNCRYCNFKMPAPQICPDCKSGYIKYAGTGTEKVESELSRIFPETKIKRLDNLREAASDDADIFISTESIIRESKYNFALIGTLFIDNSLNRIDFRSSEKTFGLLRGLLGLTEGKIVIQTSLPNHHVFRALVNKDADIFYKEELRQRKQLNFPPYQHIGLVKLRGAKESRVKEASSILFNRLKEFNENKTVEIISVNPGYPSKLRGNFYWQILIRANSPKKMSKFLKKYLRDFSHSGIIVTVDIDPL